jgi:hypothetical protein
MQRSTVYKILVKNLKRRDEMEGSYEHVNETSSSIKGGEFLD